MIVYAESSAILSWLLGEPGEAASREALATCERVVTSALTAVECDRALTRARHMRRITEVEELALSKILESTEQSWDVIALNDEVLRRARGPILGIGVRTLDALHVCSALVLQEQLGTPIVFLSLDDRVRDCAKALGFTVLPD